MYIETSLLIWLFPIIFIAHDLEELIAGEAWLRKNGIEIRKRVRKSFPPFLARQIEAVLTKSTAELAVPISLIFALACIATLLAARIGIYVFFLLANGAFFIHGFMHIGQAILLRKYVPAVITSFLIVLPYGVVLFQRLILERILSLAGMLVYFAISIAFIIPFILVMHKAGEFLYKKLIELLIR